MAHFGFVADLPSGKQRRSRRLGIGCGAMAHVTALQSRLPRNAPLARRAFHTNIATSACGTFGHGVNSWRLWYGDTLYLLYMHLHNLGTSQLPLAGAILCCTSIAPEQRVRV
jgi:hypothetical protein